MDMEIRKNRSEICLLLTKMGGLLGRKVDAKRTRHDRPRLTKTKKGKEKETSVHFGERGDMARKEGKIRKTF